MQTNDSFSGTFHKSAAVFVYSTSELWCSFLVQAVHDDRACTLVGYLNKENRSQCFRFTYIKYFKIGNEYVMHILIVECKLLKTVVFSSKKCVRFPKA